MFGCSFQWRAASCTIQVQGVRACARSGRDGWPQPFAALNELIGLFFALPDPPRGFKRLC